MTSEATDEEYETLWSGKTGYYLSMYDKKGAWIDPYFYPPGYFVKELTPSAHHGRTGTAIDYYWHRAPGAPKIEDWRKKQSPQWWREWREYQRKQKLRNTARHAEYESIISDAFQRDLAQLRAQRGTSESNRCHRIINRAFTPEPARIYSSYWEARPYIDSDDPDPKVNFFGDLLAVALKIKPLMLAGPVYENEIQGDPRYRNFLEKMKETGVVEYHLRSPRSNPPGFHLFFFAFPEKEPEVQLLFSYLSGNLVTPYGETLQSLLLGHSVPYYIMASIWKDTLGAGVGRFEESDPRFAEARIDSFDRIIQQDKKRIKFYKNRVASTQKLIARELKR